MPTRVGSFAGPSFVWNAPLSVVHPPDNVISGSQYHEALRAKQGELTTEQMRELEDQIRELEALMRLERDYPTP